MDAMEHELKFLNMLGYKMGAIPDCDNSRWDIIDENDKKVGTIKKQKMNKKPDKEGNIVFGYNMKIDSDKITYADIRRVDNNYGTFCYNFEIKRENSTDHVEMSCGQCPGVTIWSNEYGYMNFRISHDGLFANFKSKTESFNIEEAVNFKINKYDKKETNYGKEYAYVIGYCDKAIELTDLNSIGRKTREISAKYKPGFGNRVNNQVEIEERTWKESKLKVSRTNTYVGTVQEMIEKHKMGIDAISHFRYLLNKILPFKEEVMGAMLARTPYITEPGIELFLPDVIEKMKEDPCIGCATKGTCDMLEITEQNCVSLKRYKMLTGKSYIKV